MSLLGSVAGSVYDTQVGYSSTYQQPQSAYLVSPKPTIFETAAILDSADKDGESIILVDLANDLYDNYADAQEAIRAEVYEEIVAKYGWLAVRKTMKRVRLIVRQVG